MHSVSRKLPYENNLDYAYRVMKEAIMSFKLVPGTSISVVKMAEILHISGTPIKQSLAKLKDDHLVEVIPQVGTYVTKIKKQLVEQAAFMRLTLEKEILKSACRSFPERGLRELKKNVVQQEWLLSNNGSALDFHKL